MEIEYKIDHYVLFLHDNCMNFSCNAFMPNGCAGVDLDYCTNKEMIKIRYSMTLFPLGGHIYSQSFNLNSAIEPNLSLSKYLNLYIGLNVFKCILTK